MKLSAETDASTPRAEAGGPGGGIGAVAVVSSGTLTQNGQTAEAAGQPARALGSEFNSLLKHSVIIGSGMMLGKLVGFLMIPVYTRYLTPAEYGIAQLLDLTTSLFGMVLTCGMAQATLRFYFDVANEEERKTVIGTTMGFTWAVGVLGFVILAPTAGVWSSVVFGTDAYIGLFRLAFLGLMATILLDVPVALLRARQRSDLVVAVSLGQLVLMLTLNIFFIVYCGWGLFGLLLSTVLSNGLLALVFGVRTVREVGLQFSAKKLREMAAYGLPFIPQTLGMFVMHYSDRYFLQRYGTLTDVGVYSLGYKFGSIVHLMGHGPFWQMWGAKRFELAAHPEARRMYAATLTYVCLGYLAAGLAVAVFIGDIVGVMAVPDYHSASSVVPLVVLAYLFCAAHNHFTIGLFVLKKNRYLALVIATASGLNVLLNFALIAPFLSLGAAAATCLSFATMAAMTYLIAHRLYPVPWEFGRMLKMVAFAVGLYAASLTVGGLGQPAALIVKAGLVVSFPLGLYLGNFFTTAERTHLQQTGRVIFTRLRLSGSSV
jgi:O-antigen/teichoic acid export membrane protein